MGVYVEREVSYVILLVENRPPPTSADPDIRHTNANNLIYFRKPRPVPSDVHQVITTSMLAMKVSICVGVIVSSLRLQPCFAFNMPKELGGWSYRSRSSGVGVTSQSPSESPPEMRLRAEAIQLKYDLVVLAERTRRGVSRHLIYVSHQHVSIQPNSQRSFLSSSTNSSLHPDLIETRRSE